jgi:hypothetical protein
METISIFPGLLYSLEYADITSRHSGRRGGARGQFSVSDGTLMNLPLAFLHNEGYHIFLNC